MPVVTILGIRENSSKLTLGRIFHEVRREIAKVNELGITERQVSVFFPTDLGESVRRNFNCNDICVLIRLYAMPERTDEVIHEMAEHVQRRLKKEYFPDSLVEVLPIMLNPKHCSSSADEKGKN